MALTWVEDSQSRSATIVRLGKKASASYTKSYKVFGTTDDVVLHNDINATISGSFWQYPGTDAIFLPDSYSVEYLGDDAWQVTVNYVKEGADDPSQQNPLKRARSFDTGGGTTHITQALSESRYGTGAPDMQGAIGVDDNSVAGVDVVIPALQWTETYDVPSQYVTQGYINTLANLTGTVNQGGFRGFAAGEVLFVGCSGSQEWDSERGDGPWSLSYKFTASPNASNLAVGSITVTTKKGHEYLWVRYEDAVESNTLIKRPKHVYVNRVYRETSFASLGIG
jgi:hypothetical protein